MRLSTLLEVAGFACLTAAAFEWTLIAGLCAAGVSLVLIGYGTDDEAAGAVVGRLIHPLVAWRTASRARRLARREAKVGSKA